MQESKHESPEPAAPTGPVEPVTQQIELKTSGNGRIALWILLSVVVGFMLPVCSCSLFLGASIAGLAAFDTGTGSTTSLGTGDAVAIVRVEGVLLSSDDATLPGPYSGRIIADLRAAEADETVKAIVLRINSPGGTVTSAAQIHEVLADEISKPVIVSMSAVAASGGYYISAPADYIFARADTVTGSLGVILTLYNAEELINEIGVDVINITSGPNKAIGSPWQELTSEQQLILETSIDEAYDDFVNIIVDGRHLPEADVLELADGRTYSGRQAVDNGLVDELGNLQDAINKAADMGGIVGQPRIVEYEHLPSIEQLLAGFSTRLNRSQADEVMTLINEMTTPSLEYRYAGPGS
ncbi:MAG: signal peptide peptidase SppA [Anaerolineales bacterium]|nr:signal peptide peptidase SppA [Anaerolineales bacterium]